VEKDLLPVACKESIGIISKAMPSSSRGRVGILSGRHISEHAHFKMYITEHAPFKVIVQEGKEEDWNIWLGL
jgi:hypothetical protein